MTKKHFALLGIAVVVIAGLFYLLRRPAPDGAAAPYPAQEPPTPMEARPAQAGSLEDFPRDELQLESDGRRHDFRVWIADTPERRAQGLMFVRRLPRHQGMLFLFGEQQPVSMWMKNTYISLDMLFIAADGRIARIAQRTAPHSLTTIDSRGEVTAVLELGAGECARLGVQVGDFVRYSAFATR